MINNDQPDLLLNSICQRVLDTACVLQQIAAPTSHEDARANCLLTLFEQNHLQQVHKDSVGNVFGCIPGTGSAPPLVLAAHLDSVFPFDEDLQLSSHDNIISGPGIGDNATGLAGLLGLTWLLGERHELLPGDIWLVGTVGEEGLGNLKGMRAVVDRFNSQPLAYIIVEGMGLGEIYHRGLAVLRYRISVQTQGGHAWIDYGKPSANHELSCLVSRLVNIPVPRQPRSSLNVGVIRGGTSVNTIAAHAELELDLRSTQAEGINYLSREVERLARETNHQGVSCTIEVIGQRPGGEISKGHPLVRLAISVLNELGIHPEPGIGSTDANVPISRGYPAICVALTSGNGAHTHTEFIRTGPLAKGLEQLYRIVTRVWAIK